MSIFMKVFFFRLPFLAAMLFSFAQVEIVSAQTADTIPSLISVYRAGNARDTSDFTVGKLDDIVGVSLSGCRALAKRQLALHSNLILYIDNIPAPALKSYYPIPPDADSAIFFFQLTHDDETDSLWRKITTPIRLMKSDGRLKVFITAGLENDGPIFPKNKNWMNFRNNFTLMIFSPRMVTIFIIIFTALFIAVVIMCMRSDLIKVTFPNSASLYSLSKTQLALWTMIVAGSYIYIWIVTQDQPSIDSSILILLGISFGTTTISSLIDTSNLSKPNAMQNVPLQSNGFFSDILSDGNGISVHRFQNAIFTVVLAVIFVSDVLTSLQLPSFNTTLLALMGISSAGYLSLKPSEANSQVPAQNALPMPAAAPPPAPPA